MNDIVERLRTRYKVMCQRCEHFNCDMTTPHEVMDVAADEIERLRSEVRRLDHLERDVAELTDTVKQLKADAS